MYENAFLHYALCCYQNLSNEKGVNVGQVDIKLTLS